MLCVFICSQLTKFMETKTCTKSFANTAWTTWWAFRYITASHWQQKTLAILFKYLFHLSADEKRRLLFKLRDRRLHHIHQQEKEKQLSWEPHWDAGHGWDVQPPGGSVSVWHRWGEREAPSTTCFHLWDQKPFGICTNRRKCRRLSQMVTLKNADSFEPVLFQAYITVPIRLQGPGLVLFWFSSLANWKSCDPSWFQNPLPLQHDTLHVSDLSDLLQVC